MLVSFRKMEEGGYRLIINGFGFRLKNLYFKRAARFLTS